MFWTNKDVVQVGIHKVNYCPPTYSGRLVFLFAGISKPNFKPPSDRWLELPRKMSSIGAKHGEVSAESGEQHDAVDAEVIAAPQCCINWSASAGSHLDRVMVRLGRLKAL